MSYLLKIRRREGHIPDLLYRSYKAMQHATVPPVPGLHRFLAHERMLRPAVFSWVKRKLYDEPIFRLMCSRCGPGLNLLLGIPTVLGELDLELGHHVVMHGSSVFVGAKVFDRPRLIIGDRTHCGSGMNAIVGADIHIGNDVLIANRVSLVSYDGHPIDPALRRQGLPAPAESSRPIHIHDNVWLCAGATVMKGVTIGEGSVVATQAVVVRHVPPNVVVAGNPAKIVKRLRPEHVKFDLLHHQA